MSRKDPLGLAFSRLRGLADLSLDDCAKRAALSVEAIRAVEAGGGDAQARARLAALFGVDDDALLEGVVRAAPNDAVSVFLLQGANQDFDARDLEVLLPALEQGRRLASSDPDALGARLQLTPVAVAGPRPRDAARQGHRLARRARTALGLGGGPIGDLRELLEERLGIAVLVGPLRSVRAAATVDADGVAAAAVLSSSDPERKSNPTLARVYLAHELCHVLFDAAGPGVIRLALDEGPASPRAPRQLEESRAKGFQAEFLLPLDGLTELLGAPPAGPAVGRQAKEMVRCAAERFGTTREMTAYHLANHGFIDELYKISPELAFPSTPVAGTRTRLPPAGKPSLRVRVLAGEGTPRGTQAEARRAVERVERRSLEALVRGAVGDPRGGDALVHEIDRRLLAGQFDFVGRVLMRLQPTELSREIVFDVLMITRPAADLLGDARRAFSERALESLRGRLSAEELAHVEGHLR